MDMEKSGIGSTRLHLKVQDQGALHQALVSLGYIFMYFFASVVIFLEISKSYQPAFIYV